MQVPPLRVMPGGGRYGPCEGMPSSASVGVRVFEYIDNRDEFGLPRQPKERAGAEDIDDSDECGLRAPEWSRMRAASPNSSPDIPAGQLRVQLLDLAGPLASIYIARPVSSDKLCRAVEHAVGLPQVHFDLCIGNQVWIPCNVSWQEAAEVDITVVWRPPEMVSQVLHVREQIDHYLAPGETRRTDRPILISTMQMFNAILPEHGGNTLFFASEELRSNREVALRAVQYSGVGLEHVAMELQEDREIAQAAVQQDGRALTWASKRLKDDAELLYLASMDNPTFAELGTRKAREQLLTQGRLRTHPNPFLLRWDRNPAFVLEDSGETQQEERIAQICAQSHTRACRTDALGQPYRFFSAAFAGCPRCVRRYVDDSGDPAVVQGGMTALDWAIFSKDQEEQDTDWVIEFLQGKGVAAIG